jgi:hypothetical protein
MASYELQPSGVYQHTLEPIYTASNTIWSTFNPVNYTAGANSMAQAGQYGDILFNHEFSYEPYTARNIKTGDVLGKVYEVNTSVLNGLGSTNSLYSILNEDGTVGYPLYTWDKLLKELLD